MGAPFGLDFGAVYTVAAALGADQDLLTDILPAVESSILNMVSGDDAGDDFEPPE